MVFRQYINMLFNFPGKELFAKFDFLSAVELSVIFVALVVVYKKFIKGTPSESLLKGFMIILSTLVFSKLLIMMHLQILGRFLESLVNIVIFGLVVIFQPELRKFLGYIGQPGFFSKNIFNNDSKNDDKNVVVELIDAIKYFSKSHTGALIVIEKANSGDSYPEVGTKLNAIISTELLLTIFHPNTALHDGAVVIRNNKIFAAGVLLPLTEDPKLSWQYGTRHRAAIGMSEASDAVCIVVSEETGRISIAQAGKLTLFDNIEILKMALEEIFNSMSSSSTPDISSNQFKKSQFFTNEIAKPKVDVED